MPQHRDRYDRRRDRGGKGQADLKPEIHVRRGEQHGDEAAEQDRPKRQLATAEACVVRRIVRAHGRDFPVQRSSHPITSPCQRREFSGASTQWFSLGNTSSRSEEHTSELQSLMRISYAVFCLKKKTKTTQQNNNSITNATI